MASFLGRLLGQMGQSLGEGLNTVAQQRTQALQQEAQDNAKRSDQLLDIQINFFTQLMSSPNITQKEAQGLAPRLRELIHLRNLPPNQRGMIPDYLSEALPLMGRVAMRLSATDLLKMPSERLDEIIGSYNNADEAVQAMLRITGTASDDDSATAIESLVRSRYQEARDRIVTARRLRELGITEQELKNNLANLNTQDLGNKIKLDEATFNSRVRAAAAQAGLDEAKLEVFLKTMPEIIQKTIAEAKKAVADAGQAAATLRKMEETIDSEIQRVLANNRIETEKATLVFPELKRVVQAEVEKLILQNQQIAAQTEQTKAQTKYTYSLINTNEIKNAQEALTTYKNLLENFAQQISTLEPEEQERAINNEAARLATFGKDALDRFGVRLPFADDPDGMATFLRSLSAEASADRAVRAAKNSTDFIMSLAGRLANTANPEKAIEAFRNELRMAAPVFGWSSETVKAQVDRFKTELGLLSTKTQKEKELLAQDIAKTVLVRTQISEIIQGIANDAIRLGLDKERIQLERERFTWQKTMDTRRHSLDERQTLFQEWYGREQVALGWANLNLERQKLEEARKQAVARAGGGASESVLDHINKISNAASDAIRRSEISLGNLFKSMGCITSSVVGAELSNCPAAQQLIERVASGKTLPTDDPAMVSIAQNFIEDTELAFFFREMLLSIGGRKPGDSGGPQNPPAPGGGGSRPGASAPGTPKTSAAAAPSTGPRGYGGNIILQSGATKSAAPPDAIGYVLTLAAVERGPASKETAASGAWGPLQIRDSSGISKDIVKGCPDNDVACVAIKQAQALMNEASRRPHISAVPTPLVAASAHFLPSLLVNPGNVIYRNGELPQNAPQWLTSAYNSNKGLFNNVYRANKQSIGSNDVYASDIGAYYTYRAILEGDLPATVKPEVANALRINTGSTVSYDALRIASAMAALASAGLAGVGNRSTDQQKKKMYQALSNYIREPTLIGNTATNPNHTDIVAIRTLAATAANNMGYNISDKQVQALMDDAIGWLLSWNLSSIGQWAKGASR